MYWSELEQTNSINLFEPSNKRTMMINAFCEICQKRFKYYVEIEKVENDKNN
jgi:hypothetical protein